jgi:hypothetical protein
MSPDNQIGTRRACGVPGCAGRGKGEGQVMNGLVTVLRAADAAARWHVYQRRKGAAQEPYVTHLLEVAMLVAEATAAGAHEAFVQAIEMRLETLNRPQGSTAFGDRPHATVPDDNPLLLGALIEFRLRRQPDFTNSPTRRLLEEEHQRLRKSGTKITRRRTSCKGLPCTPSR